MENMPNAFEGLSVEWFQEFAKQQLPGGNPDALGGRLARQLTALRDVMLKIIKCDSRFSSLQSRVAAMRLFDATVRCVWVNIPLEFAREHYALGLITDEKLRWYERVELAKIGGEAMPEYPLASVTTDPRQQETSSG